MFLLQIYHCREENKMHRIHRGRGGVSLCCGHKLVGKNTRNLNLKGSHLAIYEKVSCLHQVRLLTKRLHMLVFRPVLHFLIDLNFGTCYVYIQLCL